MSSLSFCIADPNKPNELKKIHSDHGKRLTSAVKVLQKFKKDGVIPSFDTLQFIDGHKDPCTTFTEQPVMSRLKHISNFSHKFDDAQKLMVKGKIPELFSKIRPISQISNELDELILSLKIKPYNPPELERAVHNTEAVLQSGIRASSSAPVPPLRVAPPNPDSGLSALPSVPRLLPQVEEDRHGVIANSKNEIRASIEQLRSLGNGQPQLFIDPKTSSITMVEFTGDTVSFVSERNDKTTPKTHERILFNRAGEILQLDRLNASGQREIRGQNQVTSQDYVDSAFKLSVLFLEIDSIRRKRVLPNNPNTIKI